MAGYRNWVFTSFRAEDHPFDMTDRMTYMIFQREICPETKKEHWQGYVEFSKSTTLRQVKRELGDDKAHVEPRKGTQAQAIAYCKKKESQKNDEYFTYGTPRLQGQRTDLDSMCEAVLGGATKLQLLREFKGNALRHLGMIDRAQHAVHQQDKMDNYINEKARMMGPVYYKLLFQREQEMQNYPEVVGNTKRPLDPSDSDEDFGNFQNSETESDGD